MNELRICAHCGQMAYTTYDLCDICYQKEEATIQEIKTYLRNHPKANAMEVASGTGVSIHKITRLIKDGMIV